MFVRFDDEEIEGLYKSVDGAVFVNGRKPETIGQLILERLGQNLGSDNSARDRRESQSPLFRRILDNLWAPKREGAIPESDDKEESPGLKRGECRFPNRAKAG